MKKRYYDRQDELIWWKMTRSAEVAKESDVHVKLIGGVDMLTRKYDDNRQGRIDLFEKKCASRVTCIASRGQCWTNGEEWWWIIGVYDELKNKSEIGAIINFFSLVKEMITKSFMKMEEVQIANVCKVITMKI